MLKEWLDIASGLERVKALAYSSQENCVCPSYDLTFRALELVRPDEVRVVILGQDPYHSAYRHDDITVIWKASGLAFGYNREWTGTTDSSLQNIIKELGNPPDFDRSLEQWAKQGVLLLNTRLTVELGKPMSHAGIGWEGEINKILSFLAQNGKIVWLLWGTEARRAAEAASLVMEGSNVITTSHPCKFSNNAGTSPFTGSNCFERANAELLKAGLGEIKWK